MDITRTRWYTLKSNSRWLNSVFLIISHISHRHYKRTDKIIRHNHTVISQIFLMSGRIHLITYRQSMTCPFSLLSHWYISIYLIHFSVFLHSPHLNSGAKRKGNWWDERKREVDITIRHWSQNTKVGTVYSSSLDCE